MKEASFIGIDPGLSGGMAVLDKDGLVFELIAMPATEKDQGEVIMQLPDYGIFVLIEWINPAIQKIGKSQMSKLYGNYMALRMALSVAEIPFEDIKPVKWQRSLGIQSRKKSENTTQWKNRLKAKAQQLFPKDDVTSNTCDALLIAEYLRRRQLGILGELK